MDENYELAVKIAFLMRPKIPKNIIMSMCDVTGNPDLDNQKEINFLNLMYINDTNWSKVLEQKSRTMYLHEAIQHNPARNIGRT